MRSFLFPLWLLVLGGWVGVGIGTGIIAAPAIFAFTDNGSIDSGMAGSIAGEVFRRHGMVSLLVLPALLAGWLWMHGTAVRNGKPMAVAILVAAALALLAVELLVTTPEMQDLRERLAGEYGSYADAPREDPLRRRFAVLHGVSMTRALVELLLGAAAFVLAAGLRPGAERKPQ